MTVQSITACALAALVPFTTSNQRSSALLAGAQADSTVVFPGWPTHFEGRALTLLLLSEREQRFGSDFPGHVARFTDGRREIIVRWVTEATRKLHPAVDCFQGIGYRVRPRPLRVDENGNRWSSFVANRDGQKLRVFERIHDETGKSWTDASAWYWAATTSGATRAPWWAITIAENDAKPEAQESP